MQENEPFIHGLRKSHIKKHHHLYALMWNFYQFISSNLFKESIEFGRQFIQNAADDLSIVLQARKVLLFEVTTPWI